MRHYTRGRFKCNYDCFNCKESDCKATQNNIIKHEAMVNKFYSIDDQMPESYRAELMYFEILNGDNFRKAGK